MAELKHRTIINISEMNQTKAVTPVQILTPVQIPPLSGVIKNSPEALGANNLGTLFKF